MKSKTEEKMRLLYRHDIIWNLLENPKPLLGRIIKVHSAWGGSMVTLAKIINIRFEGSELSRTLLPVTYS
jgi:hypothetical protein